MIGHHKSREAHLNLLCYCKISSPVMKNLNLRQQVLQSQK
uniref:Uncharacterized protein n=1 Tax=Anguilla anguilla TaxID=7936 RepID=A0A0E9Q6H6_ANGAN